MGEELKACPFCEKAPADFTNGRYEGPRVKSGPLSDFGYMGNRTAWVVLCHGCCTVGPHNSEADAIAAWNRRAGGQWNYGPPPDAMDDYYLAVQGGGVTQVVICEYRPGYRSWMLDEDRDIEEMGWRPLAWMKMPPLPAPPLAPTAGTSGDRRGAGEG